MTEKKPAAAEKKPPAAKQEPHPKAALFTELRRIYDEQKRSQ